MSNTNTNHPEYVATGKPKGGGAVYRAPLDTPLPTDAVTALNAAFKCLGHCSDDGLKNKPTISSGSVKAWGGDTIYNYQDGRSDSFSFKLVEVLNVEVLKTVYGDANVEGDLGKGIHAKSTSEEHEDCSWVFDMIHKGHAKRIVVPSAKITEMQEIEYKDNAVVGYGITIGANPDANGVYHHEYTAPAANAAQA